MASAPIQARNVATGALYEGASSSMGNYTLAELPAGTYEISVAVQGFKEYVRQGLTIQVAQVARIDIPLEVGATSDSVTITAEAPLLNTENGELSHSQPRLRQDRKWRRRWCRGLFANTSAKR